MIGSFVDNEHAKPDGTTHSEKKTEEGTTTRKIIPRAQKERSVSGGGGSFGGIAF